MDQSEAWEEAHKEVDWLSTPNTEFLAFMAEHYWEGKDVKFLDLGCGTGASTLFLAKKGFKVTAVDFSETACINLLKKASYKEKSLIDVINCDVSHFNTEPESIDCAVLVNLIDCLEFTEAQDLLKRIRGWLKLDGRIFATILHTVSDDYERKKLIRLYKTIDELKHIFSGYNGQLKITTTYVNSFRDSVTNWVLDMQVTRRI